MADRRQSAAGDLRRQIEAANALVAELYPILENDDVLQRDMVEAETGLHDAIRAAVARIVEIEALRTGIQATIKVLKERLGRFDGQEERLRDALLTALEVGGLKYLETPLGTVSRKAVAPSVQVIDESAIPADYFVRADPRLDKKALLAALKNGTKVPGATLSNGGATLALKLG